MRLDVLIIILLKCSFIYGRCNVPEISLDKCCNKKLNVSSRSNSELTSNNTTLIVVDKIRGIAELKFNLQTVENNSNIILFFNKNRYLDNCTSKTIDQIEDVNNKHTEFNYIIKNNDTGCPQCDEEAKIELTYIYTGCYHLQVGSSKSLGFYLETDLEIKPKENYYSALNYTSGYSKEIFLIFRNYLSSKNDLEIKLIKEDENASVVYEGKMIDDEYVLEVCSISGNITIKKPICNQQNVSKGSIVECRILDLPHGSYTFFCSLKNEPVTCRPFTLWNKNLTARPCTWTTTFQINKSKGMEENLHHNSIDMDLLIIIIILVLCAICILVSVILLPIRNKYREMKKERNKNSQVRNKPDLFFLYAKDCQAFMETVEALRNVLIQDGKFKVFDIYDNSQLAEISSGPENWIIEKMMKCKIILILTKCAAMQKNSMTTGNKSKPFYAVPSSDDYYFMYALNHLEKIVSDQYNDLFVVNFNDDQTDYECFQHINSFTRYTLPQHLNQIILELRNEQSGARETPIIIENSYDFTPFVEKYRNYKEYCDMNPNYLREIIHF